MVNESKRQSLFVVCPWHPSGQLAGAERSVTMLVNGLINEYDITLVAISTGCFEKPERIDERVDFQLVTVQKRAKESRSKLASLLRQKKPRVVISNVPHISTLTQVAIWQAYSQVRHIVVNRGTDINNWKEKLHMYFTYFFCDAYVTVSNGIKESMKNRLYLSDKKITTIYNGFDITYLQAKANEHIKSGELIWDTKRQSIIGVGRFEEQKSFAVLLKAAAEVIHIHKKPVNVLLVGEGSLGSELEALSIELNIREYVYFLGWQENPHKYIKIADVCVLSSYFEGFGNVIVEALAVGTPVVSTDCPSGPREILVDGKYGSLVPVDNSVVMAEMIVSQLNSPDAKDFLQERANEFSNEKTREKFREIILND